MMACSADVKSSLNRRVKFLRFCFFFGIFLAGQSHDSEYRWLRPIGAWLMFGALIMLFSLIVCHLGIVWFAKTKKGFADVL